MKHLGYCTKGRVIRCKQNIPLKSAPIPSHPNKLNRTLQQTLQPRQEQFQFHLSGLDGCCSTGGAAVWEALRHRESNSRGHREPSPSTANQSPGKGGAGPPPSLQYQLAPWHKPPAWLKALGGCC